LRLATVLSLNQSTIKNNQNPPNNRHLTIDKPLVFVGAKNRGYTKNIDKNHITILGELLYNITWKRICLFKVLSILVKRKRRG